MAVEATSSEESTEVDEAMSRIQELKEEQEYLESQLKHAEQMETKPSSVTDMAKKLSEKGLVDYVRYQGVSLTDAGVKTALSIIRKHRLWEVFLVKKLDFTWDEVHEVAEQLESPLGTVKSALSRGLARLRDRLADEHRTADG